MFEATYTLEPEVVRRATAQWVRRTQAGYMIGFLLVLAIAIAGMFFPNVRLFAAFMLGGVCIYFWLIAYSIFWPQRESREGDRGQTVVRLDEDGIAVSSALALSSMPWTSVVRARATRDFLFLEFRYGVTPLVMPRSSLTPEAMAFIEQKVRVDGKTRGSV